MTELAPYGFQVLRSALDDQIFLGAKAVFDLSDQAKGISKPEFDADSTSFRFFAKNGYTYEVTTRVIAYPGMEEVVK